MKRALSGVCLFVLFSAPPCIAETVESLLKAPLDSLYGSQNAQPLVVCFNAFTFSDQGLASVFSRYLESSIALVLQQCPQYELFARDKLESILETQELALSDLFDQNNAVRIGNLKSIQAMLSGRFFDAGANVEVFLDLTSVETGTISGTAKVTIPKTLIPDRIALLPDNYDDAVRVLGELGKIDPAGNAQFAIKAWTQRGDGGTYLDGEDLVIHFCANGDCYIKIYHIGVNGDTELIFPNQFQPDNQIKKNKVYSVPDVFSGFAFTLGKPYGVEFIKVIASTSQFTSFESSLDAPRQVITRGLSVQQRQAQTAEAMLNYTILEAE